MISPYQSWGRYPLAEQEACRIFWRGDVSPAFDTNRAVLPYGLGRSYGDVCLNHGGRILLTRGLNRLICFDARTGILRCEAGVTLAEIVDFALPRGYFLPVTPGTKFVTIAGAVANDVHGKNHHRAGTFGRFVSAFELVRSDGRRLCSADSNPELFAATIGGMGLTGLMTWVEIKLRPVVGRAIDSVSVRFGGLDEFFALSAEYEKDYEYTVAWVDCLAGGRGLGRGIFMAGNHAAHADADSRNNKSIEGPGIPVEFPSLVLNRATIRLFNLLYYRKQFFRIRRFRVDLEPFFYPLDKIGNWNRIYVHQGPLQYQCVVPADDHDVIRTILTKIAASGLGSFLGVLKMMGDLPSPGMISFPKKGITLALDFPIKGEKTFRLFKYLDAVVRQSGGRLYSAKDACMTADDFALYYHRWPEFARQIDPKFSSSFWRRVTGKT